MNVPHAKTGRDDTVPMNPTAPKTTRRYTRATDRAKHAAVEATRPRNRGLEHTAAKVISVQK